MQVSPEEQAKTSRPRSDHTRQVWIDFARGIGVILVVYGHVLGGLISPHLFPDGPLAQWMSYTLYTFHMPLFFFLAGLNVQHSLARGTRPFLAGKAWTIAYPYILWSLIQGGVIMLISHNANIPITSSDLVAIWYRPMAQFWFLYALMICHVLAVLIPNRTIMIVVALAGLIVFMLLPIRPDLALTMHHLPFYVAGLYATRIVTTWRPHGRTGWITLALTAAAFAAAAAIGGQFSGFDANGAASLPACILGIASVVLLCKLLNDTRHRWLALVGVMSMTIYVLHIMAGSGTRIIMQVLHVPVMPWVYLLAGTAAGVILPMGAHVMLQRLNLLAPLGLAPLPKRKPVPAALVSQAARPD